MAQAHAHEPPALAHRMRLSRAPESCREWGLFSNRVPWAKCSVIPDLQLGASRPKNWGTRFRGNFSSGTAHGLRIRGVIPGASAGQKMAAQACPYKPPGFRFSYIAQPLFLLRNILRVGNNLRVVMFQIGQ